MDPTSPIVCLSQAPQVAFDEVAISIDIDENFAIPATLSATIFEVKFSIEIPDAKNGKITTGENQPSNPISDSPSMSPLIIQYPWRDVVMHSVRDGIDGLMMVIEAPKFKSLDFLLSQASPTLAKIISQRDTSVSSSTTDIDNNASDVMGDFDDDYDQDSPIIEVNFVVHGLPTTHIPLYPVDFIIPTDPNSPQNDSQPVKPVVFEMPDADNEAASPVMVLYQLFNQCVSLNPDKSEINHPDNDEYGYSSDAVLIEGMDDEDMMKFGDFEGMFTAEMFEKEENFESNGENGENNDNDLLYHEDMDRYKH